jgi:hypothetical protein
MDYASTKGDKLKTIGDILSKIGMVTGVYAATGAGATTAKDLAGAKVAKTGGVLGKDGSILTGGDYASGVFNSKTGAWTPLDKIKDLDYGNFVDASHVEWANKPAFLKPFSTAPAGYTAPASWFSSPSK